MENKKLQKVSMTELIVSFLPLATFIQVLLKITLLDRVHSIWAFAFPSFVCEAAKAATL
ncbi:hypothetical protein [Lutispora saccharofermentans]|uniref:hypothetical protein n=1 Tax=Lutispora saccharofermentans TaxID=3024236 RepID=UPI002FDDCECF